MVVGLLLKGSGSLQERAATIRIGQTKMLPEPTDLTK